jgi:hypothetical protein
MRVGSSVDHFGWIERCLRRERERGDWKDGHVTCMDADRSRDGWTQARLKQRKI